VMSDLRYRYSCSPAQSRCLFIRFSSRIKYENHAADDCFREQTKNCHYFAPGSGVLRQACLSVSVCVFVCLSASISPELYDLPRQISSVHVTYGRGSVLPWQLYISSFMDDVTFGHNGQELATRKGVYLQ